MLSTVAAAHFPEEAVRFHEALRFARQFDSHEEMLTGPSSEVYAHVPVSLIAWINSDYDRHKVILDNYVGRLAPVISLTDSQGISPEALGMNFVDPVEEVSRSFASLFASIQKRQSLIPSPQLSELAALAATRLGEPIKDVEAWAKKLVSDTRGADDC